MRAVELFAGIGGFRIAADRCSFKTVWANDNSPLACKVYRDRFGPDALAEGDVRKLRDRVPAHDLLTGGFPCQPFSSAGKKRGVKDPRGTLFNEVVEIVRRHQPRFFVLENVKRLLTMEQGRHFATILAALATLDYQIEWRLLKATDFGLAQNRQRVFIIAVRTDDELNGTVLPIRLAESTDLIRSCFNPRVAGEPERWTPIADHGRKFPNWGIARAGRFYGVDLLEFAAKSDGEFLLEAFLQPEEQVGSEFDFTESTRIRLKNSENVNRFVEGVQILSNQGGGARMGYTVFGTAGIAPCLTATPSRHYERYRIGNRYRRLTNVEYARLQGFPDDHCRVASVYSQYALYGNAVPHPMAEWVLGRLPSNGVSRDEIPTRKMQLELFANA